MITDIDKETIGKYLQRELGGKLVADYDNGNRKRYARIEEFDNIKDNVIDKNVIKFYERNNFIKEGFSESHLMFRKEDKEGYLLVVHTYSPPLKTILITEDRRFL